VMGIAKGFPAAFAKAQLGAGSALPEKGRAFVSVREADKDRVVELSRMLIQAGFEVMTTEGTSNTLAEACVPSTKVAKVIDGVRPHIVDKLLSDEINFIVNTTEGERSIADSKSIRQAALDRGIVYFTTMAGGLAAAESIVSNDDVTQVRSIQAYHQDEVL
jgi:carbamoyl-phosphate synthase large subunit